jgi:hypothetical protein
MPRAAAPEQQEAAGQGRSLRPRCSYAVTSGPPGSSPLGSAGFESPRLRRVRVPPENFDPNGTRTPSSCRLYRSRIRRSTQVLAPLRDRHRARPRLELGQDHRLFHDQHRTSRQLDRPFPCSATPAGCYSRRGYEPAHSAHALPSSGPSAWRRRNPDKDNRRYAVVSQSEGAWL